mmetsp:Transcript_48280/g.149111  ORF Transcript_48280/g.149111 Transcript_48280/m.149111 type:complete len:324 (-) Transcript_48280:63-1034(-)
MGCWRGVLTCDCLAALRHQSVRFKDSVQEFRYEPSSGLLPRVSISKYARLALERGLSWRAAKTLDGERYFYNASRHEYCWELPEEAKGPCAEALAVGDEVEVYCHTANAWCAGYVEKCGDEAVQIAFQTPGASSFEWVKKDLQPGHPDLRSSKEPSSFGSSAMGGSFSPSARLRAGTAAEPSNILRGFVETELPFNWTPEEMEAYDTFFDRVMEETDGHLDMQTVAGYFDRTGFQAKVLDGVWQVANPELAELLGREEFRTYCRLAAHCQVLAVSGEGKTLSALRRGGGRLRNMLREQCLSLPPPSLPCFAQPCSGLDAVGSP